MKEKSLGCTFPECFKQETDVRHIASYNRQNEM